MTLIRKYIPSKIIKEEEVKKQNTRQLTETFLFPARDSSNGVTDSLKILHALSLHPTVKANQPTME